MESTKSKPALTRVIRAKLPKRSDATRMSDAAVSVLRAELVAARGVIVPQIRGLDALSNDPLSGDAIEAINLQRRKRNSRLDLIDIVLKYLDALEADGYPTLDPVVIPTSVQVELQKEREDLEKAFDVFRASPETGDFDPGNATKQ